MRPHGPHERSQLSGKGSGTTPQAFKLPLAILLLLSCQNEVGRCGPAGPRNGPGCRLPVARAFVLRCQKKVVGRRSGKAAAAAQHFGDGFDICGHAESQSSCARARQVARAGPKAPSPFLISCPLVRRATNQPQPASRLVGFAPTLPPGSRPLQHLLHALTREPRTHARTHTYAREWAVRALAGLSRSRLGIRPAEGWEFRIRGFLNCLGTCSLH